MSYDLLAELFAGNTSVIGTEEGGCDRLDEDPVLWRFCLENHFSGNGPPVGVYPMQQIDGDWCVHWGCVDFDEGDTDSLVYARNLVGVLQHFDVTAWIEKSRSKGYHVWVFLTDWTPAPLVRRALLAACQIANAPTKEINPKQETLADEAVGNYVRLPYPANNPGETTGNRMVIDVAPGSPGLAFNRDYWAELAHNQRVDASKLEALSRLWQPPVLTVSKMFGTAGPPPSRPAERRLNGLAHTMWKDGPLPGHDDRSGWLWSFCRELVQSDVTASEAREFLYQAHDHHVPKWDEPNRSKQLDRMLAKASGA